MLFYEFCWYVVPKMLKNGINRPISTILAITVRNCKIVQLFPFFCILWITYQQNSLNNIICGWYEKTFGLKILVPWDTPRVPGAPISGGSHTRIWPTSNSSHMGSIRPLRSNPVTNSSQNSKNSWSLVWLDIYATWYSLEWLWYLFQGLFGAYYMST